MKVIKNRWCYIESIRMYMVLVVALLLFSYHNATAQECYESSVQSPTPFMGNHGEIFKLADGSMWEVNASYEYMYEYYPSVVICPLKGKLLIKNTTINVRSLSSSSVKGKKEDSAIESVIVNNFNGFNYGNIYKLANGQIWEQTEAWVWAWTWVSPSVIIYNSSGTYKMKVEKIEHAVSVNRIK